MNNKVIIRSTHPAETGSLVSIAERTAVFKPSELVALREVLDDYHDRNRELGHLAVTLEEDRTAIGFAYYAPAAMTDRAWYLYWIAVDPNRQRQGQGTLLLRHAENNISRREGRLLLIETSSLPRYEPTREFYLRQGYRVESVLADFYSEGDSLIVFGKRLTPVSP